MKFQKKQDFKYLYLSPQKPFSLAKYVLTYILSTVLTKRLSNTIHPIIYSDSSRSSISLDFHEVRQSSIFIPIVIKHSSTPPESTIQVSLEAIIHIQEASPHQLSYTRSNTQHIAATFLYDVSYSLQWCPRFDFSLFLV